jgi:predicted metal-binding protein
MALFYDLNSFRVIYFRNCMMMISEISKDEDFEKVAKKSKSELKLSPSNKH